MLATALLSPACGADAPTAGSATATPASTAAPTSGSAAGGTPGEQAAVTTAAVGDGAAPARTPFPSGVRCEQPIAIGYFGAITGNSANISIPRLQAAQLAVDEFNAQNPECRIEYKTFDTQGSPEQAPALAENAVRDPTLLALIGPSFSGESKSANPILNEGNLPFISPGASSPVLSTRGWKAFHRIIAGDDLQMAALGSWLSKQGIRRLAVVDDGSEYGAETAQHLRDAFTKAGGEVVVTDRIDANASDLSSTATLLLNAKPDAVFYGGYYEAAGRLAKQTHDLGLQTQFVAPNGSFDQGFMVSAGPSASEGALLSAPATPPAMVPGGTEWADRYRAAFGTAPGNSSMEAYDAASFVLHLIGQGSRTRDAIEQGLDTTSYQGLTRLVAFNADGTVKLGDRPAAWVYRVRNGAFEPVGPAA